MIQWSYANYLLIDHYCTYMQEGRERKHKGRRAGEPEAGDAPGMVRSAPGLHVLEPPGGLACLAAASRLRLGLRGRFLAPEPSEDPQTAVCEEKKESAGCK